MAHLVVFVLDNLEQCSAVLEAWEEAGALGMTILESTGLRRLRVALRDDLPLLPSLRDLLASQELRHRTLFTVVADEAVVERIIAATEQVVGDFSRHHAGLLFVVPVTRVLGLEKWGPAESGISSD
jgi:nitrogen regulatory protein PII